MIPLYRDLLQPWREKTDFLLYRLKSNSEPSDEIHQDLKLVSFQDRHLLPLPALYLLDPLPGQRFLAFSSSWLVHLIFPSKI